MHSPFVSSGGCDFSFWDSHDDFLSLCVSHKSGEGVYGDVRGGKL
jgi:hypothetical protein